jgi:hypothetical protein
MKNLCVNNLLYVFQGIDEYMDHANVSPPIKKMIEQMSELGWLFKKVDDFMKRNIDSSY